MRRVLDSRRLRVNLIAVMIVDCLSSVYMFLTSPERQMSVKGVLERAVKCEFADTKLGRESLVVNRLWWFRGHILSAKRRARELML